MRAGLSADPQVIPYLLSGRQAMIGEEPPGPSRMSMPVEVLVAACQVVAANPRSSRCHTAV
jgi:hypothetical protein